MEESKSVELDTLRDAYAREPTNRDVAARLAQAYTDLGWYNEAEEIYKELVRRHVDDYSLLLDFGNLYFKRNNTDDALQVFQRLTNLKPMRLEGWNNLGIVSLARQDFEAAKRCFEKVLDIEPDNCGALLNMGNYYDRKADIPKAIEMFEKAVAAKRDFTDGWFNLGNAYVRAGEFEKALGAYERALRQLPDFPSALKNLGYAHEALDEFEKAEECYLRALDLSKADAAIYVNIANVEAKQRKYDKAKEYYLKAVRLAPREASGWMGLRNLSLLKGDIASYVKATLAVVHRLDAGGVAESIRRLRELRQWEGVDSIIKVADKLELAGDDLDAERMVAWSRAERQDSRASAMYRRLSSLQSPPVPIARCLAEYEHIQGNYEKALLHLSDIAKDDLAGQRLMWVCLVAAGKSDDAQRRIREYLRDHDDCFDGWFLLAQISAAGSRENDAKQFLIKALENGFTDFDALTGDVAMKKIYESLQLVRF